MSTRSRSLPSESTLDMLMPMARGRLRLRLIPMYCMVDILVWDMAMVCTVLDMDMDMDTIIMARGMLMPRFLLEDLGTLATPMLVSLMLASPMPMSLLWSQPP